MNEVNQQTIFDAAIMAGGKLISFAPGLPNKTFIKIKGQPLFIHVIRTLLPVKRIARIYVVGPKNAIEDELAKQKDIAGGKPLVVLEQSTNLVDNMFNAFAHSVADYQRGPGPHTLPMNDRAILGVAGDSPIILPEEVDQFLDRCNLADYDYFLGMCPEESLEKFHPRAGKRGIRMACTPFAEGLLRIGNLHLAKPFRIMNRAEFHEIYKIRHLRKIKNIFKFAAELMERNLTGAEWRVWGRMFLSMKLRKAGLLRLADYLRKEAHTAVVEAAASKILGTRARIVITGYGGAAVDVDHASNVAAIEENYDEWMAAQRALKMPSAN